jgi:FG-GAP repeat
VSRGSFLACFTSSRACWPDDVARASVLFDTATGAELATLLPTDASPTDYFGITVDVAGDLVAVGAFLQDGVFEDTGAAYLFSIPEPATAWLLVAFLFAIAPHRSRSIAYL